jgi:cell wall-associated protease
MANITSRTFTLGTLLVGALSLGAHAQNNRVLVIDEGIDLQHETLKKLAYVNLAELNGVEGKDDDKNGFIDDTSGWNAVSNDAQFFPDWMRKAFEDNAEAITKLLGVYDRIEDKDPTAINFVRQNPGMAQAIRSVLGWSHGTHVGGIVVHNAGSNIEVASINLFSSSEDPSPSLGDDAIPPTLAHNRFSVGSPMDRFTRILTQTLTTSTPTENDAEEVESSEEKPFVSQFDNTEMVSAFLLQLRASEVTEKRMLTQYTQFLKPRVVNLSLGVQKFRIRQSLDSIWQQELLTARLPRSTPRSEAQEKNYQRMLNESFEIFRQGWNDYFRANSGVLFVVAAGNDAGTLGVPSAGNNGVNEVLPANCSKDNANVITVAATNTQGVLADFSNFNSDLVNIAAWGTAVPSLAPNDNKVKMSGTSMAAPNAAGLASKILATNRRLTPAQARQILEGTVKKVASLKGRISSEGMIDPQTALDAAQLSLLRDVHTSVREAVRRRTGQQAMPNIFSGDIEGLDRTRVGQVHVTPELVKQFMR